MEMRTGKTLASIAILGALYQFSLIHRAMVVCPVSIKGVWEQEIAKLAAFPCTVTVMKDASKDNRVLLKDISREGLQVFIVNYKSARIIEKELPDFDADLIIVDEAHKIKKARTVQSKTMHHLDDKASYKLLLTDTLITNRELDVFSQYRFLNRRIFGNSFYAFRSRYFDMTGCGNHIPRFRNYMFDDFLQRMHSIAYRVTKAECLDLPDISEKNPLCTARTQSNEDLQGA